MPLDPSIIGSFRPPEVMSPVNAMAQMYQLRALQGESEKNQLAMEKSRRDMAREDTLRNLLAGAKGDTGSAVNALRGGGFYTEAEGIEKSASELRTKELEQAKARNDIFDQRMKQYHSAINMSETPEELLNVHNAIHKDDYLGPMLANYGISPDTGTKQIMATTGNPEAFRALRLRMGSDAEKFHELNKGVPITRNLGATTETILLNPMTGEQKVVNVSKNTISPEDERRLTLEERRVGMERQRMDREATTSKQRDNEIAHVIPGEGSNVTLVSKTGKVIQPSSPIKGRPSATYEKAEAQRKQITQDLNQAIFEVEAAVKPGGLIDQSTGSGLGRVRDLAARGVGVATSGDIAIGKLKPIADLVLKLVPRFEGPQSNADTQSYQQAAGQLADPTMPREIRKEAANVIIRLMKNRKNQFVSQDMINTPTASGGSGAPASGVDTNNPLLR